MENVNWVNNLFEEDFVMKTLSKSLIVLMGLLSALLTQVIASETIAQAPNSEPLPSSNPSVTPNIPQVSPSSDAARRVIVGPFERLSAPSPANVPEPVERGPLRELPVIPEGRKFAPVSCGSLTWGEQRNTGTINLGRCN
jgi:hypothetical protein